MQKNIEIRGARVHNLQNIDVDIPRNKLVVITGVSGSGKSSLAFDTLYAEGQRRFVESLSAYSRQFLQRMDKPDVDEIRGISPAIAIEQKNPTRNSRSTVATATEIHDYLRLLYARIGRTFCPECGEEVKKNQVHDVVEKVLQLPENSKIHLTFPLPGNTGDEKLLHLADLKSRGFNRILLNGNLVEASELTQKQIKKEDVYILVDRLKVGEPIKGRLADSADLAFREGHGALVIFVEKKPPLRFSQAFECAHCGVKFIEPEPRLFSFNNPFGACARCNGFGEIIEIDLNLVIPNPAKSLLDGAVAPWNTPKRRGVFAKMQDAAIRNGIDLKTPWQELPEEHQKIIIEGDRPFPGINGFFKKLERKKYKIGVRVLLARYRGFIVCPDCNLTRLRPEALYVKIGSKHIAEVSKMPIWQAYTFFCNLELTEYEKDVAQQILQELQFRLKYLDDVGLGYLSLDRRTQTLSGGEYQRINLAASLGFKLVGSLYVLDEPSIGLHPRDNARLIKILQSLRDLGNTVVVVEHDRETMEISDFIVDLGPKAGQHGGEIVFSGTFAQITQNGAATLTSDYLKEIRKIPVPKIRRQGRGKFLKIVNASENNLKNITVEIPLGKMVAVTGVSGSGKSTLVHEVLFAALSRHFGTQQKRVGRYEKIEGVGNIDGIEMMDQSPIGRTPRSNPVTYTKTFDEIRKLFTGTIRAKSRGLKPGAFSFNTTGGRCERCEGAGVETVEMQFLADVTLTCEACDGARYEKQILDIFYKGKNISDVLKMTITEALAFFSDQRKLQTKLQTLEDVGVGYLQLGQSATTLSGGEAQRVKLAAHLGERANKRLLYIFDEPTTGLHFHDIAKLLECMNRLIEKGHSVLFIEHNLDMIKNADHVIDLGPEGGEAGGEILVTGSPEQIADCEASYTGQFLRRNLNKN